MLIETAAATAYCSFYLFKVLYLILYTLHLAI